MNQRLLPSSRRWLRDRLTQEVVKVFSLVIVARTVTTWESNKCQWLTPCWETTQRAINRTNSQWNMAQWAFSRTDKTSSLVKNWARSQMNPLLTSLIKWARTTPLETSFSTSNSLLDNSKIDLWPCSLLSSSTKLLSFSLCKCANSSFLTRSTNRNLLQTEWPLHLQMVNSITKASKLSSTTRTD